jgi:cholesterol transport system auxiliary component
MAVALTALSACSILPDAEVLTVYQLPALAAAPQNSQRANTPLRHSLRIATPYSSHVIDSARVVVVPQGSQISAYSGVRWSDSAPVLVRDRLASAFRTNGRLASVITDHGNINADLGLTGDLSAFQVEYHNGAPTVRIRFDAALVKTSTNRAAATRRFEINQPVQGKEIPEVVTAFGAATDSLAADVVNWTLDYINQTGGR